MRLEQDERDRKYRMTWDDFEARVREWNAKRVEDERPLSLGDPVAWISRDHGKASYVSAIHCHYESGQTFCKLDIPPRKQHLPTTLSLNVCGRCEALRRRALQYAKAAGISVNLKVSA